MTTDAEPRPEFYLEDFEVGQSFESGEHVITADEIIAFATQFDPQPFHTDPVAAVDTFFGGLAASGWHTAALSMRLMVESVPIGSGLIGAGGELLWPRPVRPGDTLTVETEVLSITPSRSRPGRASVAIRALTRNQHGETVQSFSPKLVVLGREGA